MSFTQQDARAALREADEAGRRSHELRGYQSAAPHLVLWGAAYATGYAIQYVRPGWHGLHWPVLSAAALAADCWIVRTDRCAAPGRQRMFFGLGAIFSAFVIACLAVFQPQNPLQTAAFPPLVVALGYMLFGILKLPRLMWTGAALGVLTLLGFFALPDLFLPWMAVVGGGALILGGVWMRRT